MAHTDARSQWLDQGSLLWSAAIPVFLAILPYPYFMFAGIAGFFFLCLWQTYFYPGPLVALLYKRGFVALGLLLILSASFAVFPGEAYLQLTHFLPFFWFWAAIALYLRNAIAPWRQISYWALVLVLVTVPLNIVGIVELFLKQYGLAELLTQFALIDWFYIGDLHILRAYSLFDYPNTLASYLVMILGLNLGLVFLQQGKTDFWHIPRWCRSVLALNLLLTLVCLFCSGSRNGYLVALLMLIVSFIGIKTYRWVKLLGFSGFALIVVTTLQFGIGGRTLSWSWVTDDPRVGVWNLALQMIRDRPLLGQGLGNFKLLYNGEVPDYDYIAHAHNFWLMLGSEAGLPTMILFTLVVGLICHRGCLALVRLRQFPNHYSILLGYHLCFLGIVLFSLLDITLSEARVNLLAWLSLGVVYSAPELSRCLPDRR